MTRDRVKSWYFRNLEWERKHPKFMICLRIFVVLVAIFTTYFLNHQILELIGWEAAIPLFISLGVGFLFTASLVYLLYRKLKKTWLHEWEIANEESMHEAHNDNSRNH